MNLGELKTRVFGRLDDDSSSPAYYTASEVTHALNVGLRLFALLTLCVERTATVTLSAATPFYTLSASPFSITDFLAPLKLTVAGARVRPSTLHELDMLSTAWRATAGAPAHYIQDGYELLAIYPQPAGGTTSVVLTYAAVPAALAVTGDSPEIPEEQQPALIDFAIWWLRSKEGGAEFGATNELLTRFLDTAQQYGNYVRGRSQGQLYDRVPPDLARFDRGRFNFRLKQVAVKERVA